MGYIPREITKDFFISCTKVKIALIELACINTKVLKNSWKLKLVYGFKGPTTNIKKVKKRKKCKEITF
jgi:hypothetical protein